MINTILDYYGKAGVQFIEANYVTPQKKFILNIK